MKFSKTSRPEIVHIEEDFLIVNKPAGLLTLPDRHREEIPHLGKYLDLYGTYLWVHRLDKNTSGLLVVARNAESHKKLNLLFAERQITKKYLCLVRGIPSEEKWTTEIRIKPSTSRIGLMEVHPKGKRSITKFRTIERFKDFSLLEVEIVTGRMHQIRVTCGHLGLPILGDGQYGKEKGFYLSEIKKKKYNTSKNQSEKPLLSRSALHAASLSFSWDGDVREFVALPPKDIRAVLNQLRKNNAL